MGKKPYSDPRWHELLIAKELQCNSCVHHRGGDECDAFPNGIPRELLLSNVLHVKPYKDDNGIRYEKDPNYIPPPDFLAKPKI